MTAAQKSTLHRVPESASPAWAILKAVLMLTALVLVGFHLHPLVALVLLLVLADPFLLILGDAFRARRGAHHSSP